MLEHLLHMVAVSRVGDNVHKTAWRTVAIQSLLVRYQSMKQQEILRKYQLWSLEGDFSHRPLKDTRIPLDGVDTPPDAPAFPLPGKPVPLRKPGSTLNSMVFSLSHYILPQLQNDLAKVPQKLLLLTE